MSDQTIHLACVTDEGYAPWCAAMLHSALANVDDRPAVVHLLHPVDLPAATLARLRWTVRASGATFQPSAIDPDDIGDLTGGAHFPPIIWYRSLLPHLRPDVERVLYLDCDTLVTDRLIPLWETDLTDRYAAAVQNLIEPVLVDQPARVGIPAGQTYFNSGVLLMDLGAMRRDDIVARVHAHARANVGISIWPDQDSLNFVLGERCVIVHPRWNCQNSFFHWPQAADELGATALREATTAPGILHFEGPPEMKPWHYLSRHPWRADYWAHLRATPFRDTPVQGRTFKNHLRRWLPDRTRTDVARIRRRLRPLTRRRTL